MGNTGSSFTKKTTIAAALSSTDDPSPSGGPSHRQPKTFKSGDEVPSSTDKIFNQEKDATYLSRSETTATCQDVVNPGNCTKEIISRDQQAVTSSDEAKPSYSGKQSTQWPQASVSVMTPVTLPSHEVSRSSGTPTSTGVSLSPYGGRFPTRMSLPPFPSYLPVGTHLPRYPAVESYSAMLANMGTQFQMAQEQSHHLMQPSYIPGGYITLPSPHVTMSPVLIPAASLHDVARGGLVAKTGSGHIPSCGPQAHMSAPHSAQRHPYMTHDLTHTKAEHHTPSNRSGGYIYHDAYTRPFVPPLPSLVSPSRRNSDLLRQSVPHESGSSSSAGHTQIPSLESVLGKTTYPQNAIGPGGVKVELPPPTISIHIGARPTNLGHPNMTLPPPPLVPKSSVYMEPGRESSKVVPSSLGAPKTCIGESFAGGISAPYIHQLPSIPSHSQLESLSSVSRGGMLPETYVRSFAGNSSRESERHRSNSSPSGKPWLTNPPHVNIPEPFHVKQEPGTGPVPHGMPSGPSSRGHDSPKDRKSVQSSRPILTSQAPPPMANVPSYFTRGSIIQLANGILRRVEELRTEDFITSAQVTDGLKIDSSTVSRIEEDLERNVANISFLVGEHNAQVTVEARLDHPFFVYGQGWSSVSPEVSHKCYALNCHTLAVGDVCISLTVMEKISPEPGRPPPPARSEMARTAPPQQSIMNSPERKRQRFHETRTTHFEESLESEHSAMKAPFAGKSRSLEHQSTSGGPDQSTSSGPDQSTSAGPERPTQGEGVVIDQNRNIVSSHASKTPIPKEVPRERWNQPPKRRWSDPIKSAQAQESKEQPTSAPQPTSLSKVKEES